MHTDPYWIRFQGKHNKALHSLQLTLHSGQVCNSTTVILGVILYGTEYSIRLHSPHNYAALYRFVEANT
jgi:hypothetical protein